MKLNEDAPTNNVGSGNIDGVGIGPKGEPGFSLKVRRKYKEKNIKTSDDLSDDITLLRRKSIVESTFSGHKSFIVPLETFTSWKNFRLNGAPWNLYISEEIIRSFASQNPKEPIIIENAQSGAIFFARY